MLHRAGKPWNVRPSIMAVKTKNPIRDVIEHIQVVPNPLKKCLSLSVGDPTVCGNLYPPQFVFDAIRDNLEERKSRSYGPTVGLLEARKAVAEYSRHRGKIDPKDVILCSGCTHAIELVVTTLANPGQNILLPRPGHMVYKTVGEGSGILMKYYDLVPNQNWKVDLEDLESKIDEDTALIVVCNPSNPCGSVYDAQHLKQILEIASRNRVPILSDEIYEHFVFSGRKFTPLSSLSTDVPVITCSGITKRFLVPGWRLGWLIVHDRHEILGQDIRKGLENMCGKILGPSVLVQQALPAILEGSHGYFHDMLKFIESQAQMAYKMLHRIPGLRPIMPQGAMYMMIEIQMSLFAGIKDDVLFVEHLLREEAVMCLPGQCFGYPNFMRIVLTVPEEILIEACERISSFCLKYILCQPEQLKPESIYYVSDR